MTKPNPNALPDAVAELVLDTAPLMKAEGAKKDDDDDEDDEYNKSMPSADELLKSLDALSATGAAAEHGVSLRQTSLHARAAAGEFLTGDERAELVKSMVDDDDDVFSLTKSHADVFADDPTVAQGLEISDFLEASTDIIAKSLDSVRDDAAAGRREQEMFNGILAKSIAAMGRHIAHQGEVIGQLQDALVKSRGSQAMPARGVQRAPQSRVGQPFGEQPQALTKSNEPADVGGVAQQLAALGDTAILGDIEELIKSTEPNGLGSYGIVNGHDLNHELIKFESTGVLSGPAMEIVARKRGLL